MKILVVLLGVFGLTMHFAMRASGGDPYAAAAAENEVVTFYGNGSKKSACSFEDGLRSGPAEFWFPDGRTAARGTYLAGERHGWWDFWTEDGQRDTERTGEYERGQRVHSREVAARDAAQLSADS